MTNRTLSPDQRQKAISRVTLTGSVVNLLLLAFKFIAGFVGHSSAMIADAIHSLSDFVSDIIVLVFVKISVKPDDADHDYGHAKFETFATLIIGVILGAVGIAMLADGVYKTVGFFRGNHINVPGSIALWAAALSIVAKEGLYQYTRLREKTINSPALLANAWHHRSDALTSIATLIGIGGAFILGESWAVLDPLAAAAVSLFIIKAAYGLVKPATDELLEKALPEAMKSEITDIVMSTPGVMEMHRLRTRRIGSRIAIDAHIKMDGGISLSQAHVIATEAEHRLREKIGHDTIVTLHMEPVTKAPSYARD